MFPTALKAGVNTVVSSDANNWTNLGTTPESTTTWIFSLAPSVRYDKAQQVSPVEKLLKLVKKNNISLICLFYIYLGHLYLDNLKDDLK